jgi:hypothetical protein
VKVQIWEEEVTELTKELKNRELDRLREVAKAEREKSGKQLEEQEREIMRLKTLLHGEKNEWYRLMEQERAKYVACVYICDYDFYSFLRFFIYVTFLFYFYFEG